MDNEYLEKYIAVRKDPFEKVRYCIEDEFDNNIELIDLDDEKYEKTSVEDYKYRLEELYYNSFLKEKIRIIKINKYNYKNKLI